MALMRREIDKRTLAGLASEGTVAFAHGLAGVPDTVVIRRVDVTATANWNAIQAVINGTNVTLQNCGSGAGPDMEVCTMRFHSLIQ